MNKVIITGLFVIGVFFLGYGQQTENDRYAIIGSKANTLLEEAIKLKDFPAVSAGIFKDNGSIWEQGRGYLDIATAKAADHTMLHRIASITKPMTGIAVMQLVEAGLIDLDVPIQQYLPEFPRKPKGDITMRQLLHHTSGIKAYKNSRESYPTTHYENLDEAMNVFKDRELHHTPGTAYAYSTYGYVVAGAVIERVTGMSYAEYMRKNVWEKAGMLHTDIEEFGKAYPNKASLYRKNRKGTFVKDVSSDLSVKYPGGGLHSTAGDLLRFGQAVLNNSLITQASLKKMLETPDIKRNGTPYGLGWFIVDDPVHGKIIRHSGGQSGTSTYLAIYLDKRLVVSVLSNTSRAGNEVFSLMKNLSDLVLKPEAIQQPVPKAVTTVPREVLKRYTGVYRFNDGAVVELYVKGDQLWSKSKNRPDLKLYPLSESAFFYRQILHGRQFEFMLNAENKVETVVYKNNGKTYYPQKIK